MSKHIFRLQKDNHNLSNALNHWDESSQFDDKQIGAIKSSNVKAEHQPTSIPSPFARIALVKTAFAEVALHKDKALQSYKNIVSHTLDVAELFFYYDKWDGDIEIIEWKYKSDGNSDLEKLRAGHSHLHKTLNTFLGDDALTYNFDKLQSIYILKHKDSNEYIGATSPSTLFFSSANDYSNLGIKLDAKRIAFKDIAPLSKRSWRFQKFLYAWMEVNYELRTADGRSDVIFKEMHDYLEYQKQEINRHAELSNFNSDVLQKNYLEFRGPDVEIIGKPLYKAKKTGIVNSDDVFEDKIIVCSYPINKENFFDGNPNDDKETLILPVKNDFLEEYSLSELRKNIKIDRKSNIINVKLELDGNVFQAEYSESEKNIIKIDFDCALFPSISFEDRSDANYRFGIVSNYPVKDRLRVEFGSFDSNNELVISSPTRISTRNENKDKNYFLINFALEKSNIDFIRIIDAKSGAKGILLPNIQKQGKSDVYKFVVDFGTTNTHIEYQVNAKGPIKEFDIRKGSENQHDEKQIVYLHGAENTMTRVFDEEYIPLYTGNEFKFPTRTALSFGQGVSWTTAYPFEKAGFNFLYEKKQEYPYNQTITNLKWSDDIEYQNMIKVYIESIMYFLRNKVIINGGSLSETEIAWSYPVSMERNRFNSLKDAWTNAFKDFFNKNDISKIKHITESIAPFQYYIQDRDTEDLVTIDIGGGTSDIVIAKNGKPEYITSFRFAANTIFGDGYAENNRIKNGIVRQFFDQIKNNIKAGIAAESENKSIREDITLLFDTMWENKTSEDIASFLFSIEHNYDVVKNWPKLAQSENLGAKLKNDRSQKITFIIFYTAILYHLAQLMNSKKLPMPGKIVFSGNGSKVIQYLTSDSRVLIDYSKLIFEDIYDQKYPEYDLEVILEKENPKEATCKGGFYNSENLDFQDILNRQIVLHSDGSNDTIERRNLEKTTKARYESIDDKYLNNTVLEVSKFLDFVFEKLIFFQDQGFQLDFESVEIAKKESYRKLEQYMRLGYNKKSSEVNQKDIIIESPFFYPLIGVFKDITDAICDAQKEKQ